MLKELIEKRTQDQQAILRRIADFYSSCRNSLNPNISVKAVVEMLIQHIWPASLTGRAVWEFRRQGAPLRTLINPGNENQTHSAEQIVKKPHQAAAELASSDHRKNLPGLRGSPATYHRCEKEHA